jgi:dipeptidase
LWIKPKFKISAQNLKDFMRDEFQGTEMDLSKGFGAGAFGSKLRNSPLTFKLDSVEYGHDRPVATQQTAFSVVAQMRSWLPDYMGGLLWFGVDDAACNLYVPMYCGIDSIPNCFSPKNGSLVEYSSTSAFWIYNWVSNFAYTKYASMQPDIKKVQSHWENDFNTMVPTVEKSALDMPEKDSRKYLSRFSVEQAENSTSAWKKLGEYLLVKYLDGNVKKEQNGKFMKNEFGIPPSIIRPGYPEEFLRKMVKEQPSLRIKTAAELKNRK